MADAFIIITCCILFALYVLCVAVSEGAFRYLNRRYKWVERELRLLRALLQDVDEVSKSEYETTQKAHQLLDSDLKQDGRTVRVLDGWEERWRTKAKEVVKKATWCVDKLTKRRELSFPKWFLLVVLDLVPMVRATLQMNKLNEFLGEKENDVDLETNSLTCLLGKKKLGASDIYRSLEQSRSRVRSLQDRSVVGEIEHKHGKSITVDGLAVDELFTSLENLRAGNPHLTHGMDEQIKSIMMHLQLLSAFMKDLKQLKGVETEMEKSWTMEANETIMEAKLVLETINATANKRRWLSKFSNWMARRKLQKDIMRVSTWISGLLETKERYGFKFVRRDSSKSARRPPHHQIFHYETTDDMDLLYAVNKIHNWLNQLQQTSDMVSQAGLVSKELENMHKLFKGTKATKDSNLRSACLEQLKKTADELENSDIHLIMDDVFLLIRIMDAVGLLNRCLTLYSIEVRVESLMSVVGLEEDVHELVLQLTTESGSHSIISIVGMNGIGKTTLARKVFDHSTIEEHFAVRRWVSVPQKSSDENELLTIVGKQILGTQEEGDGKDYFIKKVKGFLKAKLCLLVFDNVSSNKSMYTLKETFPEMMKKGSRIVLTTHNKAIASNADQNSKPHQLRLRTKQESWEIFTQMVDCPPEMETLAKKVVRRSGGLPLAILRFGYRMSGKKVTSEKLLKELGCMTQEKNQTAWSGNVKVNEEVLQFHPILSRCFSYFKNFPKDTEIPARRIVNLWIAQGLVQLREDGKTNLESDASKHLMELIGRDLIQVVQRKPNGKVKTCCLPTSVLDNLLEGEGKVNRRNARSWSSRTTSSDRQLAFHFHKDDDIALIHGLNKSSPSFMQNEGYHHSYLIFDTQEGNKPREDGETLRRGIDHGFYGQLQVLDLEHVFRPQLPETIGKLKQLTYLGLRWTYLGTIPDSIGNLVNLLTLDLKHTHLRTLPSSMWKLKKLRHLYLNQNCRMPQPTAIHMRNLQILSGTFVDKINLVKDHLDKLINLRKLGLTFQLTVAEQNVLEAWIKKLIHLESLKLTIKEKSSRVPHHLNLECIKDLNKLSSLYLFGRLDEKLFNLKYKLPQSLTHLTLSASGIRTDPMTMLGKLPNLKWLKLNSGSYNGTDMVCSKNLFPRLLVLRLWNLDTLKKLDVQEGAMINLMELEFKSCRNLTIITGLEHLTNLRPEAYR